MRIERFEPSAIAFQAVLVDLCRMDFDRSLEKASAIAPAIVCTTFVLAVAGAWFKAPHWPSYGFSVAVFLIAFAVWSRKGMNRQFKSIDQLGFRRNRDWLGFVFFSKSMPRGYFWLVFASFVTIVTTGNRVPYAALGFAGMLLTLAWGEDQRTYPSEHSDGA